MPEFSVLDAFVAIAIIYVIRWLFFSPGGGRQGNLQQPGGGGGGAGGAVGGVGRQGAGGAGYASAEKAVPVGPAASGAASVVAARLGIPVTLPRSAVTIDIDGILLPAAPAAAAPATATTSGAPSTMGSVRVAADAVATLRLLNQVADVHLLKRVGAAAEEAAITRALEEAGVIDKKASAAAAQTAPAPASPDGSGSSPAAAATAATAATAAPPPKKNRALWEDVTEQGWLGGNRVGGGGGSSLVGRIKDAPASLYGRPENVPRHKLVFYSTGVGKLAILRQLKPSLHIDVDPDFIQTHAPFAKRQLHVSLESGATELRHAQLPQRSADGSGSSSSSSSSRKAKSWLVAGRGWFVEEVH